MWRRGAVAVGCRENTAEFIEKLSTTGHGVSGIVTISRETADRNQVPTWADLSAEFGQQIPVYVASSYALDSATDRAHLSGASGDVGFCIGWQRMLPDWFLERYRNGVFGMHASATALPDGRGRSPINWGVIEGAESLIAHIFRYNGQPDAGELLSAPELRIEPHDDIQTLQQKAWVIFVREAISHWEQLVSGSPSLQPLRAMTPADRVYPKRSAEDGAIDWSWPSKQITNWVRAQTRPYPGALRTSATAPSVGAKAS